MECEESMKDRSRHRERSGDRAWRRVSQGEEEDRNTDSVRETKRDTNGKKFKTYCDYIEGTQFSCF